MTPLDDMAERIGSRQSLGVECFEWLKQSIVSGYFPPGTHIREKFVAEQLNISRSPIREAFVRLSEFGLGQYVPNRGFRVVTLTLQQVEEVGQVRSALENLAVKLVVEKATRQDLSRLEVLVDEAEKYISQGGEEYPLHLDFHATLLDIADNQTLTDMLNRISATVRTVRTWSGSSSSRPSKSLQEHRAIYKKIAAGDVEEAARTMTRHIQASTETMLECVSGLEQSNGASSP
jgi:DNA-binding GntR family transcriptional regulator